MKKFFKVCAAATALVMAAGCFAGCGKKDADADGMTTVSIWSSAGHSKEVYEKMIEEYNKGQGKKDGVKLEFTYIAGDSYSKSIELALQNGTAPDLMTAPDMAKSIEEGRLMAIDDLPGGDKFIEQYKDALVDRRTTWDGKTYRVPVAATTMGLAYNTDMFKKAGIVDEKGNAKPPKTLDEMREDAKKLTDAGKKQYGIIYPSKWAGAWADSDIIYPSATYGGHLDYDYLKGVFDFSQTKPFFENMMGIIADGSCFPGRTGIDNDMARAYFAEGNIGMKIAMSFDVGVWRDQFPAKCNWEVAPLPVVDENNAYKQRLYYEYSFVINAKSADRVGGEKLMNVFDYFTGKDAAVELYKQGISIPYNSDWVKDVKIDDSLKQWKQFVDMLDISIDFPGWPGRDSSGGTKSFYDITEEILGGQKTVDEGIAEYNKIANDASARYYQDHPNPPKKPEEYIIPDWNPSR